MKLLFDQNLSFKLSQRLAALYPGSTQARFIGMDQEDDSQLWEYARHHGFTIVTQDGDFSDLSCLHGWPPKVLWLRCGNQPSRAVEHLLRVHYADILLFESNPTAGVLEIS
jgi:predicted nuclease of predicted toxin-antitoxin system